YREPFRGRKRAAILLVSKAPAVLSREAEERIIQRLKPLPQQCVCFSSLAYEEIRGLDPALPAPALDRETHVLLVTGIARPGPFLSHVRRITPHVQHLKYPDHHSFTLKNIAKIAEVFERIDSGNKMILTTEKDAARLSAPGLKDVMCRLPVFYWPVRIQIHGPGKDRFDKRILDYVGSGSGFHR
ncbi:MAG TPA: tetraacyldisaccharide 4'-kinase, partial [Anseongella sp.]|nr:tetraacyldisaccharide 4'-kinase [Anseongella sp.]